MKYYKIEGGKLVDVPRYIMTDEGLHINPSEAHCRAAGYYPLVESVPEHRDGYIAEARYAYAGRGANKHIVQSWEYAEGEVEL